MSLRIALTGAGMAGVSAGRLLADRGHRVTLLEKSRGGGGRCATKRWEGCYFAGNALGTSRVEDAWLAGRVAALQIIQSSPKANTTLTI